MENSEKPTVKNGDMFGSTPRPMGLTSRRPTRCILFLSVPVRMISHAADWSLIASRPVARLS